MLRVGVVSARCVLFLRNHQTRRGTQTRVETNGRPTHNLSYRPFATNHVQASFSLAVPGPLGGGRVFYFLTQQGFTAILVPPNRGPGILLLSPFKMDDGAPFRNRPRFPPPRQIDWHCFPP
jgi:hypothetical protein